MIPNNALHQLANSDSMSALILNAYYERRLQQMSQELQSHQQRSSLSPTANQVNVPSRISLDGQLYALLPITDQGIGGVAENQQSLPVAGGTNHIIAQYRDDSSMPSRDGAPPTTSSTQIQSISHKKGKSSRGKQPRPTMHVPPKAFVSITSPSVNDVLMGRGGRVNKHVGNVQLRNIVAARQEEYLSSSTGKLDKAYIAADIVSSIRLRCHPPGRFLEQNPVDHTWYEIGDERAVRKVLQALREHAPEFRSNPDTVDARETDV